MLRRWAWVFAVGVCCVSACESSSSPSPEPATGGESSSGGMGTGGDDWVAPACDVPLYDAARFPRPAPWDDGDPACPPGPFFTLVGRECDEGAFRGCDYGGHRYTGFSTTSINSAPPSCSDGKVDVGQTLVCCDDPFPQCPDTAEDGVSCAADEIGECYVPGPGAEPKHGFINGQVCACDPPGPRWRCATICQLCDFLSAEPRKPAPGFSVDCGPVPADGAGGVGGSD